jgi:hypothetical protein
LRQDDRLVTADRMGTIVVTNTARTGPLYWPDVTTWASQIYNRAAALVTRAAARLTTTQEPKPQSDPTADATGPVAVSFANPRTLLERNFSVTAESHFQANNLGITVDGVSPAGSDVVVVNNAGLYEGQAVKPAAGQNMLTQLNTGNVPASFTLKFSKPWRAVSFTVPAVLSTTVNGITFPAWKAVALSQSGGELSSTSVGLLRRFANEPARTFTLTAPGFDGIAAIRFESDPRLNGRPFAAFSAIVIEQLILTPEPAERAGSPSAR